MNTCSSAKAVFAGIRGYRAYPLHLKHHCIPAMSAAMERCFSAARYIVNVRRSRHSDHCYKTCSYWVASLGKLFTHIGSPCSLLSSEKLGVQKGVLGLDRFNGLTGWVH